jgi:uncharacterized protein YpmB
MVSKKLFSAVVATVVILSIVGASSVAFAQTQTTTATATANATKLATATANATKLANATTAATTSTSSGFLGLPGFEAIYGVAGLLVVAYLVLQRRK